MRACLRSSVSMLAFAGLCATLAIPAQAVEYVVTDEVELRSALQKAGKGDTIILREGIDTIFLTNPITGAGNVVIDGNGGRVDGGGASALIGTTGDLSGLQNITLSNGRRNSGFGGAALDVSGVITGGVVNSNFYNNIANFQNINNDNEDGMGGASNFTGSNDSNMITKGGALSASSGIVGGIAESTFNDNRLNVVVNATYNAYNVDGFIHVSSRGRGEAHGGAIAVQNLEGSVSNSRFTDNIVDLRVSALAIATITPEAVAHASALGIGFGSAISVSDYLIDNIENSEFIGNAVKVDVQATAIAQGTISSTTTADAQANGYGGAVSVGADFEGGIVNSLFQDNSVALSGNGSWSQGYGGALYVGNNLAGGIAGSVFSGNSVAVDLVDDVVGLAHGGAVAVKGQLTGGINAASFEGNSVVSSAYGYGGAVYVEGAIEGGIAGSSFLENIVETSGDSRGGALYVDESFSGNIQDSTFSNNQVISDLRGYGGAIAVASRFDGNILDSLFIDNNATISEGRGQGGAIYTNEFSGDIRGTLFSDNAVLFVTNEHSEGYGGALYVQSDFHGDIVDTGFVANHIVAVEGRGGAIYSEGDFQGRIVNSDFSRNSVTANGSNSGGDDDIDFEADDTVVSGGAITVDEIFDGEISNTDFVDNSVSSTFGNGLGGAIVVGSFSGVISDSLFAGNNVSAGGMAGGGAVAVEGDFSGSITDTSFAGNSVSSRSGDEGAGGGAISIGNAFSGVISNTSFVGNSANSASGSGSGGAIAAARFDGIISDSLFAGNNVSAGGVAGGGAIAVEETFSGDITNTSFSDNSARGGSDESGYGGAIAVDGGFSGDITNSNFSDNSAIGGDEGSSIGGAIAVEGDFSGSITNTSFVSNRAIGGAGESGAGGAIATGKFNGVISNTNFVGNSANSASGSGLGGAIAAAGFDGVISDSMFIGNSAGTSGGAIYLAPDEDNVADIVLTASAGKSTIFQGNIDGSGANSIAFGNDEDNGSQGDAALGVSGAGTVALYDPISVDMNNGFSFNMSRDTSRGKGLFIWGGVNTLSVVDGGAANVSLAGGNTVAAADFSLKGATDTVLNVTLGADHALTLDSNRASTLAVFDYTQAGAGSSLMMTPGTGLELSPIVRSLTPIEARYLIVDGIMADASGIVLVQGPELSLALDGSTAEQLWLSASYAPVITGGPNVQRGLPALDQWLKDTANGQSLSDEQYLAFRNDLDSATPEAALTLGISALNIHSTLTDMALGYALAEEPADHTRIWAEYIGNFSHAGSHGGYSGYDTDTNGFLGGVSFGLDGKGVLGGYAGFTRSGIDFKDLRASAVADGAHLGLFWRHRLESGLRLTLNGAYSHFSNDLSRNAAYLGESKGSFAQNVYSFDADAAYPVLSWQAGVMEPFAAIRYMHLSQNGFTEAGGALPAHVDSLTADSFATTLGVAVKHDFALNNGVTISAGASLGWKHEFGDTQLSALTSSALPTLSGVAPISYETRSLVQDRDTLQGGVSLGTSFTDKSGNVYSFKAGYGLELGKNRQSHSAAVRFGVRF